MRVAREHVAWFVHRRAGMSSPATAAIGTSPIVPWWAWVAFAVVVVISLAVDLVLHRGDRVPSKREGIAWSIGWVAVSLSFGGWVWLQFGGETAVEFVTAYLVEKSLSIDNLFVFLLLFKRLRVPHAEQHRVLFWGVIGAFATRALFILAGTAMLSRWHFMTYVRGAFLVYTGMKTVRADREDDGAQGWFVRVLQKRLPITQKVYSHRFTVIEQGKRLATPLLIALIAIELTDLLFAVDSIAAVLAISNAPFIVFTSNVFAILGLRALYLVLVDLVADLEYLDWGLGGILVFVGAKMLLSGVLHMPHWVSLLVTLGILIAAVVPSLVARRRRRRRRLREA